MTQSGLAKQLGDGDVRRLPDPRHQGSRLARLLEALAVCGLKWASL